MDLLEEKPMTMKELADLLHVEKSFLWMHAIKNLLGGGFLEKGMGEKESLYFPRVRGCVRTLYHGVINKEQCLNTNTVLDTNTDTGVLRGNQYPTDPEEVVKAAKESGYIMSLKEAAKFFAVYAAIGWIDRNGFPIRSWRALLPVWQLNQTPEQLANARKEYERREQGLAPIDPEEKEWEYYTDAQGRKWRKRPDESEWEGVPELITFADGSTMQKGVL